MKQYADILVFDKDHQLVLIAEVKHKRGTSAEWASRMRRNMYAHGLMPTSPYFLLALPDRFYLWNDSGKGLDESEPMNEVDPSPFLRPYYAQSGTTPDTITGKSFELIVSSWLNEVLKAGGPEDLKDRNQDWLINSGLFERLSGGYVELEEAA